jgi:hypothetical protein
MHRTFRSAFGVFSVVFLMTVLAQAQRFPSQPDSRLTPGHLCQVPDSYRYPEKIKYCERNVSTDQKQRIIDTYDATFGYGIRHQNRQSFKIDHYIPLCMGGSNERSNLWPQHESIYRQTDALEGLLCEKMKYGKIKQVDAINLIRKAKNNLSMVPGIIQNVSHL